MHAQNDLIEKSFSSSASVAVPSLDRAPAGLTDATPTYARDVTMEDDPLGESVAENRGHHEDMDEALLESRTMPQADREGLADVLPFADTELVQDNRKEVLIRLYTAPTSWNPTKEVSHLCDGAGYIDLTRLALELHVAEKAIKVQYTFNSHPVVPLTHCPLTLKFLQVIHPKKLRPVYEHYPGRLSIADAADLLDDGGYRVCAM
jgi:hypothetical protein